MRGSWRSNITAIFWPSLLWPSTSCLSRSPWLLNRRPRGSSAGWWLSLLHLISIFSGPQLIRAPSPFGLVWLSLPHLVYFPSPTLLPATQLARRTQLSYIIVRRPLDLWNRMFNRHQAEITVMQFRGASLCSGTVGPSPCPILSALIRPRDLFRLLAIGMCHFLLVHHLGIAFLGRVERSKHNKKRFPPCSSAIVAMFVKIPDSRSSTNINICCYVRSFATRIILNIFFNKTQRLWRSERDAAYSLPFC